MAGVTGERPLRDIITDLKFWVLHAVNFTAVFISGWLFVSTGLVAILVPCLRHKYPRLSFFALYFFVF